MDKYFPGFRIPEFRSIGSVTVLPNELGYDLHTISYNKTTTISKLTFNEQNVFFSHLIYFVQILGVLHFTHFAIILV